MADVASQTPQNIPSLDGFRAISVLIVLFSHAGYDALVPGGLGVTIFFFLSGYLITTLMLAESQRTGDVDIPKFYARRVFRLMPPLVISLAIAYGLTFAGLLSGNITTAGLAAQLLYFANYYGIFFDPGNTIPEGTGILWSLAVEEHFYIVYPLLMSLLLGAALRPRSIGLLLGTACVVILVWRMHLVHSPGFTTNRTYYASDTRIDSIIYGCILAIVWNPLKDMRRGDVMSAVQWGMLAIAAATLLATLVYRETSFRETFRYSLQGLALMPIFYLAVRYSNNFVFRQLNWPWIKRLGVYSYAIYLIHYVVIKTIGTSLPGLAAKPYLVLAVALTISVAYAALVDRYVDRYFKQLRHRFRPRLATSPAV
jgi:peptidoglycan/LPS O-acetylase OafA/YrhL